MVDWSKIGAQISEQVNLSGNKKPEDDRTLYTKEQFTNSIMSALNRVGADKTQKANFKEQASSIFTQYDNSPVDNKWTQTEANNGGANALASFYEMVNNALKGIESPASVNPKVSPEAAKGAEEFNSLTPEQQAEVIKHEIDDMYAIGDVTGFDGEKITVRGRDGQEFDISLSQLGLSKETIEQLKPVIEDCIAEKLVEASADNLRAENINSVLDGYEQKGFYPVGTPVQNSEGDLIGTLQNANGEEIKLNLNTGKVVDE